MMQGRGGVTSSGSLVIIDTRTERLLKLFVCFFLVPKFSSRITLFVIRLFLVFSSHGCDIVAFAFSSLLFSFLCLMPTHFCVIKFLGRCCCKDNRKVEQVLYSDVKRCTIRQTDVLQDGNVEF